MYKTLSLFILMFVLMLPLQACGGDSKDSPVSQDNINIDVTSLEFDADGGDAVVNVSTTGEWSATTAESWIELVNEGTIKTSGKIKVSVKPNSSRKDRSGEILLISGRARAKVSVSQKGKEPEPVDPSITVPDGYELVWNDEFDSGTVPDASSWTHEVQSPGWVNNELQTYVNGSVDGSRVTSVADGILSINCFKQSGTVYSGRIYAKVNEGWKYGIFEARIKLPSGKGTWPAFWMMPVNNDFGSNPWPRCGEIDIMEEVGYNPDYTSSSIHCESYNHVMGTQRTAERYTQGAEEDFHVYRLEWTPEYILTSVDGHNLLRFENDGLGKVETWPFNKAFYLILNLAWGGNWGGAQGVDESALPATMEVDYVRVFQKQ